MKVMTGLKNSLALSSKDYNKVEPCGICLLAKQKKCHLVLKIMWLLIHLILYIVIFGDHVKLPYIMIIDNS